jgi:hypothetical protein
VLPEITIINFVRPSWKESETTPLEDSALEFFIRQMLVSKAGKGLFFRISFILVFFVLDNFAASVERKIIPAGSCSCLTDALRWSAGQISGLLRRTDQEIESDETDGSRSTSPPVCLRHDRLLSIQTDHPSLDKRNWLLIRPEDATKERTVPISVVTYNTLAHCYATTSFFPSTDPRALQWNRRKSTVCIVPSPGDIWPCACLSVTHLSLLVCTSDVGPFRCVGRRRTLSSGGLSLSSCFR